MHPTNATRRGRYAATAAVTVTMLTALALPAGCTDGGAGAGGGAGGDAAESVASGPRGAGGESTTSTTSTASTGAALLHREVIQRAHMRVHARDVGAALVRVRRIVGDVRGIVADERTETGRGGDPVRSTLTLRVPADAFESVLAELAHLGRLGAQRVSTEDVSAQVVDVEARILSARRTIERLRELLQAADDFSDVLSLESELARREADLASLEAQQAYLEDQTSLSTITLALRPPRAHAGDDDVAGFTGGLATGWDTLVALVGVLLTALGVLLPLLLVLLPMALLALWLLRRALRRRPVPGAAGSPPQPPA